MAVTAAMAVALLLRSRRHVEAVTVAVAALGAGALVVGFKHLYGRARPPVTDQLVVQTNASLPSGHALGSMVVLGVLAVVGVLHIQRPAIRAGVVGLAVVLIAAIGLSRIYLGVHWITDVLTGWLLGGAWLAVCSTALLLARTPAVIAWRAR
jgi:undecaprenyl-diphosphatase